MRLLALYTFLLLCVLHTAACQPDQSETAPRDTTPAPAQADEARSPALPDRPADRPVILVLGNSLAAGYGLNPEQAFPALLQQRIDSLGWPFHVENAGLSGETTAGGLRRLDWLLRGRVDVLILELGGNDGLRGIAPDVSQQNLETIIERTRAHYPDVRIILAGMQVPPNLGADYTTRFREMYPTLAREQNVELIPFLLEGVGGIPSLNLGDGIHPNVEGHRIVAENVWQTLRPVLESMLATA